MSNLSHCHLEPGQCARRRAHTSRDTVVRLDTQLTATMTNLLSVAAAAAILVAQPAAADDWGTYGVW